jgi:hypothetical protein
MFSKETRWNSDHDGSQTRERTQLESSPRVDPSRACYSLDSKNNHQRPTEAPSVRWDVASFRATVVRNKPAISPRSCQVRKLSPRPASRALSSLFFSPGMWHALPLLNTGNVAVAVAIAVAVAFALSQATGGERTYEYTCNMLGCTCTSTRTSSYRYLYLHSCFSCLGQVSFIPPAIRSSRELQVHWVRNTVIV